MRKNINGTRRSRRSLPRSQRDSCVASMRSASAAGSPNIAAPRTSPRSSRRRARSIALGHPTVDRDPVGERVHHFQLHIRTENPGTVVRSEIDEHHALIPHVARNERDLEHSNAVAGNGEGVVVDVVVVRKVLVPGLSRRKIPSRPTLTASGHLATARTP